MELGALAGDRVGTAGQLAKNYAAALKEQDLDAIGELLAPHAALDIELPTRGAPVSQHAAGRLAVLRGLAAAFRWYTAGDVTAAAVDDRKGADAEVEWRKGPTGLVDVLAVSSHGGHERREVRIERIRRRARAPARDGPPASAAADAAAKQHDAGVEQLAGIVAAAADAAEAEARRASPRQPVAKEASPRMRRRIESTNPSADLPILDFSFRELATLAEVMKAEPRQGQRVRPPPPRKDAKAVEQAKIAAAKEEAAAKAGGGDDDEDEELTMVKAKNRKGEEAAYSYDRAEQRRLSQAPGGNPAAEEDALATAERTAANAKFTTHAVRLSNNQLTEVPRIAGVLKQLVHHSMIHLTWLDLSCNVISVLPDDLHEFPLQVLYLHSNNIQNFAEVKKLSRLSTLKSLTLWNNPIENKMTQPGQYKIHCLHLLTHPDGREAATSPRLRKLDHVVVSRADLHNCQMYREMTVLAAERRRERSKLVTIG